MDFSCMTILHIVYVIPKEKWSDWVRRCRMCTRLSWVCIHMSDNLPVACGPEWYLLSPSKADLCTTESHGTFPKWVALGWALHALHQMQSLHTMCARAWELYHHQGIPGTWGNCFSKKDFDIISKKIIKTSLMKQDTQLYQLTLKVQTSRVNPVWELASSRETDRAKVSDISLTEIRSPPESILFSSLFWEVDFQSCKWDISYFLGGR